MTHAPENGTINLLHFSGTISGTCVMQIWDRIHLVPYSSTDYNTVLLQTRKWCARDFF